MTVKIYGPPNLTSTGRVLITLFEKNVEDFEVINVDMMKGEHHSPEYKKNHPFGMIPYMVDGELTLFVLQRHEDYQSISKYLTHAYAETRAIARYIETKFADQGTPLYGSSMKDRALTEQWLEVEAQNYCPLIHQMVYNVCFAHLWGLKCDDDLVASATTKFQAVLDIYEKRLYETKYLAGDFFGLADLSHITYTWFLINMAHKTAVFDGRPRVKAWVDALFSRPSTQKWLKLGGLAQ